MGYARLGLYIAGLIVVVLAAWVFLTQTEVGRVVPGGVALALILLLVGIGVMASAKSINDSRVTRRVAHDGGIGATTTRTYETGAPPVAPTYGASTIERRTTYDTPAVPPGETVVEERRYD